jgi:hypothetical protein
MQKLRGVTHFLVQAGPHAPKTVHPALRALHPPTAGLCDRPPASAPGLPRPGSGYVPCNPMRRATPAPRHHNSLCPDTSPGGVRLLHGHALDSLAGQRAIMPMSAVHGQTDRHATAVGVDAAVGADRAAISVELPPYQGMGNIALNACQQPET